MALAEINRCHDLYCGGYWTLTIYVLAFVRSVEVQDQAEGSPSCCAGECMHHSLKEAVSLLGPENFFLNFFLNITLTNKYPAGRRRRLRRRR